MGRPAPEWGKRSVSLKIFIVIIIIVIIIIAIIIIIIIDLIDIVSIHQTLLALCPGDT